MRHPKLDEILLRYRAGLQQALGQQLSRVVLYGSQARGEAWEGSDIDVLVVMRDAFDPVEVCRRTSALAAQIGLDYEVLISTAFKTEAELARRNSPYLATVAEDMVEV